MLLLSLVLCAVEIAIAKHAYGWVHQIKLASLPLASHEFACILLNCFCLKNTHIHMNINVKFDK